MSEARIFLHPLVIMNIADHHARKVAESKQFDAKNPPRVLGAVFGTQQNQVVEVMSSVEITFTIDDEKQIRMNDDTFAEDTDLYKQIYPEHECLGWYSTATDIMLTDLPFHKRFTEYNESPLYIRMNPVVRVDAKALPVNVYRMEMKIVKEVPKTVFIDLPFKVVSEPAERVTTDHIIQDKDVVSKFSQIVPHFETFQTAIEALQQRIQLLISFLEKVENNEIEGNQEILKNIQGVCNRIPTMVNEKFEEDFHNEMSNGMMMTYLAAMTKAAQQVNNMFELCDNMLEMRGGQGGMMERGMRRFG